MESEGKDKASRVLRLQSKLLNGEIVNKLEEADYYNVDERTIQRDIATIKDFFSTDAANRGCMTVRREDTDWKPPIKEPCQMPKPWRYVKFCWTAGHF